jgi:hypothetical protein
MDSATHTKPRAVTVTVTLTDVETGASGTYTSGHQNVLPPEEGDAMVMMTNEGSYAARQALRDLLAKKEA